MPSIEIDNFKVFYDQTENSTHGNVLFIHGNLASKEWWHPTMELLKSDATGYDSSGHLVAVDWRGYGESLGLKSYEEIDFDRFAEDHLKILDSLNLKDVKVVGHSTGGLIALMAILKRPELFKSCVLLDSVGPKGLELQLPKDQVLAHFQMMADNPDYCKTVMAATIHGVDPNSSSFEKLFNITRGCDSVMWKGVIDHLSSKINITEQIEDIKLPTLILHGEKDMVLPLEGSKELHRMIPHSDFKVLKNHGHSFNQEDPKGFVAELSHFWN